MGTHLIDGEFQSDKYPTTPRGKVPLSVKDRTAQDLLWQYAQRRRAVDAEFAADLETALYDAGYVPADKSPDIARLRELPLRLRDTADGIEAGFLADPHGHRAGLIRASADAIDALLTELETLRAREVERRKGLEAIVQRCSSAGPLDYLNSIYAVHEIAGSLLTPASPGEGK